MSVETIKKGYLTEKEIKELNFNKKDAHVDNFLQIAWIDPWNGVLPLGDKKPKKGANGPNDSKMTKYEPNKIMDMIELKSSRV
jgi:hypothetical protein